MKLLLTLILCVASLTSLIAHDNILLTYDFSVDKKEYSAHLVIPGYLSNEGMFSDSITSLLNSHKTNPIPSQYNEGEVLDLVETWVINRYESEGLLKGDLSKKMKESLTTIESIKAGRSSVIFITPKDNIRDIQALIRVDSPSLNQPHLSLERRLLNRGLEKLLPRNLIETRLESESVLILGKESGGSRKFLYYPETHGGLYENRGAIVEIKNFVNSSATVDFIPLLFALAETHKISKFGNTAENGSQSIAISDYYLECDGIARKRYYEKMGWTQVGNAIDNPDFPGSKTFIMHIDRPKFKSHLEKLILNRKGAILVSDLDFRFRETTDCRTILGTKFLTKE